MPAPLRWQAPQTIELSAGPFKGMRQAESRKYDPSYAWSLTNCFPADAMTGGPAITRPGRKNIASFAQLGVSARVPQLVYQFDRLDGTRSTVAIVDGTFYTLTWGGSWANTITAANFTTAGVTLSATNPVYAVTLNNTAIFSDGVNTPWSWDGTAGAGGITKLTNAPVFYGQPVVYAAKLFGIVNATRSDIQWSEENQPNTGYVAGGFNNAWTLSQTGSRPLQALAATNLALYTFRSDGIQAIYGQVTPDFKASATRDSVSDRIGTYQPAPLVYDNWVWFFDQYGRPCAFPVGGQVIELWHDFEPIYTTGGVIDNGFAMTNIFEPTKPNATQLGPTGQGWSRIVPLTAYNLVAFFYSQGGATGGDIVVLFHAQTKVAQGYWFINTDVIGTLAPAFDTVNNRAVTLLLNTAGRSYTWANQDYWLDDFDNITPSSYPLVQVIGPRQFEAGIECRWDLCELEIDTGDTTGTMNCTVYLVTPFDLATYTVPQSSATFALSTARGNSTAYERTFAVGFNAQGRWVHVAPSFGIAGGAGNSPVRIHGWRLVGIPMGETPESY